MTCFPIARPEPQVLFDKYRDMFQNIVLGGGNVIPESNEWYAVSLNYAMAEEFYAISEQAWKERDPRTACIDNLLVIAERDGMLPFPAQPAQGFVRLFGVPGTPLPTPLNFTIGGQPFITSFEDTQPTVIDAFGDATIRVRAVVPGTEGNIEVISGTLDTVVPGVIALVSVAGQKFCGGTDSEDIEVFRQRYINRLAYQPRSTDAWLRAKILEWPCVTRVIPRAGTCCECQGCNDAWVGSSATDPCEDCGCAECGGKMHYYVMFDETFVDGIAPRSVLDDLEQWIFGRPQGYGLGEVEIGICGRIYSPISLPVNVTVDLLDFCPTASQSKDMDLMIRAFFTTARPSMRLDIDQLRSSLNRYLRCVVPISVEINNLNSSDDDNLSITYCDVEPACDYLPVLSSIFFVNSSLADGCDP